MNKNSISKIEKIPKFKIEKNSISEIDGIIFNNYFNLNFKSVFRKIISEVK